jgi:hypothetical protein
MQILIVEIKSNAKARQLSLLLSSIDFVKKITVVKNDSKHESILKEYENFKKSFVKKKNKAIFRYL